MNSSFLNIQNFQLMIIGNNNMKFELIYGRSGTGKSTYIYEKINQNIKSKKNYLIVPEQSNLMAEKNLIEYTKSDTLLNTVVLTLSRMAKRVRDEVGGLDNNITSVGKSMIIYNILQANKSKLNFLGKTQKNITIVSQLITELNLAKTKENTKKLKNNLKECMKQENLKIGLYSSGLNRSKKCTALVFPLTRVKKE